MMSEVAIRKASAKDIGFLVDTIVAAEKSGTDNFGLAKLFELSEEDMRHLLSEMLEEEIDGCELSVSSFIVADHDGEAMAAFAGWIEGQNEDGLPSSILKSNLIGFVIPKDNLVKSQSKSDIVRPLQIEREVGTYQLEYSYTKPNHRGKDLMGRIIDEHIKLATESNVLKIQVHVFANNLPAIRTYEKKGFVVTKEFVSNDPLSSQYFPSNKELLMEKFL